MGKEQAETLSNFVNDLTRNVGNMLKGFQKNHKEMSNDQAKSLADFVTDLTKNVGNMIKGFQKEHKEMADNLRTSLEKGETDRLKSFKSMMGNIRKDIKDIESYVANKLKEFSDAHADMSEELKKDLDKYVSDIASGVKKLLGEYSSDMKKAANAWQGMSKTLARARKGGAAVPKVEAKVKVRPIKEAVEEVEEEEVSPETELEEKVLKFIKKHPEGVKVGDMEEPLGVARTRLGVIAKRLLDEGRVRKEENLYFPL
jgi:Sec-independent protein translocase protein TatA